MAGRSLKIRSIVEVELDNGTVLTEAADERYRGGPDRPFTREELHEKFTECAEAVGYCAAHRGDRVTRQDLPASVTEPRRSSSAPDGVELPVGTTVEQAEKNLILKTLDATEQNKTRAAEILGISLKTLHNKLKKYRESS